MKRFIRSSFLMAFVLVLAFGQTHAADIFVSGILGKDDVRVFLKENTYIVNKGYHINGTLIIEPGTELQFNPNGRIQVNMGGRLIADGDAKMAYSPNPVLATDDLLNPRATAGSLTNPASPISYFGYADPAYFLHAGNFSSTLGMTSTNTDTSAVEPTVHTSKYNNIYNVVLDTTNRTLSNLDLTNIPGVLSGKVVISSTQAMMWMASRMNEDFSLNPVLNSNSWKRLGGYDVNIGDDAGITFRGQPVGRSSKEWGHIVVMPGARAAFFRNVTFTAFKKDTTVDNDDYFSLATGGANYEQINADMKAASNGAGGVITTFTSRTWILGCNFNNNIARLRGGAVQFLEGPVGFPTAFASEDALIGAIGAYPLDKNPNITNPDGSPSDRNDFKGLPGILGIPAIDMIDGSAIGLLTDAERQAHDDGRISVYLARFRNNNFSYNVARLANSGYINLGPGLTVWDDILDQEATYPFNSNPAYVNGAYGGAIYLGARANSENQIEVGFGVNHSLMIDGALVTFEEKDTFVATNNQAQNYQKHGSTLGARGGAIYAGDFTSVIVAGYFNSNQAYAVFFQSENAGHLAGDYAMGGAIYAKNTLARLQVRGGGDRKNFNNSTIFSNNIAGSGGALFVAGNTDPTMSPFIGGSDALLETRDYGYNVLFQNNKAISYGGAIYSERNMSINGAGGVEAGALLGYGGEFPVRLWDNTAGYGGGALTLEIPNATAIPAQQRNIFLVRASFRDNVVGADIEGDNRKFVKGGGAVYSNSADLNVVKGTEFLDNITYNSNGGGIEIVHPLTSSNRFFITDLDVVQYDINGVAVGFTSTNDAFIFDKTLNYVANTQMLTRFIGNKTIVDQDIMDALSGSGTTQVTATETDVNRYHPGTTLPENGVGLGGAMYILDIVSNNRIGRTDSLKFNRVRIQNNSAYSGAAIYSDNYNMKLVFNRSLVTGNTASSQIGFAQNMITGPIRRDANKVIEYNEASSDVAGAIIYGEVQGPLPSSISSEAANSFYDNNARFLIRLPDAPNSKGILTGTTGLGDGGTDTLRGNYWGRTEANVKLELDNIIIDNVTYNLPNAKNNTFFVRGDSTTHLSFSYNPANPTEQGPFESLHKYSYTPVLMSNEPGDQTKPNVNTIPENVLMSGQVYDLYDKGTDIKTADYTNRRMYPIEDFAVGIPAAIKTYGGTGWYAGKYVKRMLRDPSCLDDDRYKDIFAPFQMEYGPSIIYNAANDNYDTTFYQPIGQPVYLEAEIDYSGKLSESNDDPTTTNETVFFVVNERTTDFIRVRLTQVSEEAPYRETFRGRVDLVPDSSQGGNPLMRRTTEGLLNFGIEDLYDRLYRDAYIEDATTLLGRKYQNAKSAHARIPDLFSNRPDLPTGNGGQATYFAGERYNTLPVRLGDTVRIISRSVLWQDGPVAAFDNGISFAINRSVEKPKFTGDMERFKTDTTWLRRPAELESERLAGRGDTIALVDYLNTVWVTEDRDYPQPDGTYDWESTDLEEPNLERGVDSIGVISAIDVNHYYDPRAHFSSMSFSDLTYSYEVAANSGLKNWLMVDTLFAEDANGDVNMNSGARGYFEFRGSPVNPYVVPGGEKVTVSAESYPPHYRTIDALKATYGWSNDNDTLAKLIELYPDYFHAQSYDNDNARFLQQDTVDIAGNNSYRADYEFTMFVVDQEPVFLDWGEARREKLRTYTNGDVKDTIAVYEGSLNSCGQTDDLHGNKLIANLTDKLRFQVDINTDDEIEDFYAAQEHNWKFKYGRTAYSFKNLFINGKDKDGNDDIIVDDDIIVVDEDGNSSTFINQIRPSWMADKYFMKYDSDTDADAFGDDLTLNGQMNFRIDKAEAIAMLTPVSQFSNRLNTDTTFALVINDGHGGKLTKAFDVFVNIAPEITTTTLSYAKEDSLYNPQLLRGETDSNKVIQAFDPNFGQSLTFKIIRIGDQNATDENGDPVEGIFKDPCFRDAGYWALTTDYLLDTPDWIFINDSSGILYGTPGVNDAPLSSSVSVLVTDEHGLTHVKTFSIEVRETSHPTLITGLPDIRCVEIDALYSDTFLIKDRDLLRKIAGSEEEIILTVDPSSLTLNTPIIKGQDVPDGEDEVRVVISGSLDGLTPDANGKITITITAKSGSEEYTKSYQVQVSEKTDFVCAVRIENSFGHYQILEWGIADINVDATTGDARDDAEAGSIDKHLCEQELPPLPEDGIFDARWFIDTKNGLTRSIYPDNAGDNNNFFQYHARFRTGGEGGGDASNYYPITISWPRGCVPDIDDTEKNAKGSSFYMRDGYTSGGSVFSVNMTTNEYAGSAFFESNTDSVRIVLSNSEVKGFIIYYDYTTGIETETATGDTKILSVSPNPVQSSTEIKYVLDNTSDVSLEILDVLGNVVFTINDGRKSEGTHTIEWNSLKSTGERVAAGTYTVRLSAGSLTSTYSIVVID